MAQKGRVVFLQGTAVSKDANGRDRLLKQGDVVFSGDIISIGSTEGSMVKIIMDNGREYVLMASDVVRLRGEAPVDESFDAAGIIKSLLEQDAHRTEKLSEEYHNDKTKFAQSGKNTNVTNDTKAIHSESGSNSSGSLSNEFNHITKTGHYAQLARSLDDINKNITEVFEYQAGEKNNVKTSSIASTSPAIKASAHSEPTPAPTPVAPPQPSTTEFHATAISVSEAREGFIKTSGSNYNINITTAGNGDEKIAVYLKDASGTITKLADTPFGLANTTGSLKQLQTGFGVMGRYKIAAFKSSEDDSIDSANAADIFNGTSGLNAVNLELYAVDTNAFDRPEFDTNATLNLPLILPDLSLEKNQTIKSISLRYKALDDSDDTVHELVFTTSRDKSMWWLTGKNKIDISSNSILESNVISDIVTSSPTQSNPKSVLNYDEIKRGSDISLIVNDIFGSATSLPPYGLNMLETSISFLQNVDTSSGKVVEVPSTNRILTTKTADTTPVVKVDISQNGLNGGNELLVYAVDSKNVATKIGSMDLPTSIKEFSFTPTLTPSNEPYKFIVLAHDKGAAETPLADIYKLLSNPSAKVASATSSLIIVPEPKPVDVNDSQDEFVITLPGSDEPHVSSLKIMGVSGFGSIEFTRQNAGEWQAPASLAPGIRLVNSKIYVSKSAISGNKLDIEVKNDVGVTKSSSEYARDRIEGFMDTAHDLSMAEDSLKSLNGNYITSDTTPTVNIAGLAGERIGVYAINQKDNSVKFIGETTIPDSANSASVNISGTKQLSMGQKYNIIALKLESGDVANSQTQLEKAKLATNGKNLHVEIKELYAEIQTNAVTKFDKNSGALTDTFASNLISATNVKVSIKEHDGNLEPLKSGDVAISDYFPGIAYYADLNSVIDEKNSKTYAFVDRLGASNYGLKGYVYGVDAGDLNGIGSSLFDTSRLSGHSGETVAEVVAQKNSQINIDKKFSIDSNLSKLYFNADDSDELDMSYFANNASSAIQNMQENGNPDIAKLKSQGGMFEIIGTDYDRVASDTPQNIMIQQKGSVWVHSDGAGLSHLYIHHATNAENMIILKVGSDKLVYHNRGMDRGFIEDLSGSLTGNLKSDSGGVAKFTLAKPIFSENNSVDIEILHVMDKDVFSGSGVLEMGVGFGDENGEKVALGKSGDGIDLSAIYSADFKLENGVYVAVADVDTYKNNNGLSDNLVYKAPDNDGLIMSDSGKLGGLYKASARGFNITSLVEDQIISGKENIAENITSGSGDDFIDGHGGANGSSLDIIDSGAGDDTIVYRENTKINGGIGTDTVVLLPGVDNSGIKLSNVEKISLGDYNGIENGGNFSLKMSDIFPENKNSISLTIDGNGDDALHLDLVNQKYSISLKQNQTSNDYYNYTVNLVNNATPMDLDVDKDIRLTWA